jgi:multisubunit Na+/H+ antiporter MnhG subunit
MLLGLLLMILGVALPFVMVLHLVEASFFLVFVSFISSTGGMFLGMIGAATYVREYRDHNRH